MPHKGRIGKKEHQDWYRSCVKAAKLARTLEEYKILIISNFRVPGCNSDCGVYASELIRLKIPHEDVLLIAEESETIGQIERALAYAKERPVMLVFVSSVLHWPRVWWLTRKEVGVERKISFGIPRPKEAVTDIVLAVVFPVIDLMGKRDWFKDLTRARRNDGVL